MNVFKDPPWLMFFNYIELTIFDMIVNVGECCINSLFES